MALATKSIVFKYEEAIEIYDYFYNKLANNQIAATQIYSFPRTHLIATSTLPILGIIQSLLATKSLGIVEQSEVQGSGAIQWVVVGSTNDPEPNFNLKTESYREIVELFYECIKIFSNKIIKPKVGQRYAFQGKYFYAFSELGADPHDIITALFIQYSDAGNTIGVSGESYLIS